MFEIYPSTFNMLTVRDFEAIRFKFTWMKYSYTHIEPPQSAQKDKFKTIIRLNIPCNLPFKKTESSYSKQSFKKSK